VRCEDPSEYNIASCLGEWYGGGCTEISGDIQLWLLSTSRCSYGLLHHGVMLVVAISFLRRRPFVATSSLQMRFIGLVARSLWILCEALAIVHSGRTSWFAVLRCVCDVVRVFLVLSVACR